MKKLTVLILILSGVVINAQHTISGTFTPANEYKWLIAYHLKVGEQAYTADTAVKNGEFNLSLPKEAAPGTYRLVYAVPQEEFYFDVIYNGKEDVQLNFDIERGISFSSSKENKLFEAYLREINGAKQAFINFYQSGETDTETYKKLIARVSTAQNGYEKESEGLLAHHFIVANRPYIPTAYETSEMYAQHKMEEYFDHFNVNDPVLQGSAFLTDKLSNYVFTAITKEKMVKGEKEKILQQNVDRVASALKATDAIYRFQIFQTIYNKAATKRYNITADYIFNSFIKPLAQETGNQKIVNEMEIQNHLQIGAIPPEITWEDDNTTKRLSGMEGADYYILVFWSSTCSHCLSELPPLHERLKQYPNVKTIAIGLEDAQQPWGNESAKLSDFEHVLALDHWDSRYAKIFDIHKTPTFFILDADKRIVSKPENDKEVVAFLKK
ncbi:hypothetical protein LCGC14_0677910 [marine sediment metagenome]|uniref:Redoxin domain-containing protein n=2 Tax=root TaxID=1 RepID=A0A831QQ58_9FLAO|nr:redoxin domain-containing protein [Pricia sp.]HEA20954.1 redoxin domain-containing protein [Pricia antarctica]